MSDTMRHLDPPGPAPRSAQRSARRVGPRAAPADLHSAPIVRAVARLTGIPCDQVRADSRLDRDLGLDRFDRLELLDALERLYERTILDDEDAPDEIRTVGDLESRLGGPSLDR
jgi:acyl carrier protein